MSRRRARKACLGAEVQGQGGNWDAARKAASQALELNPGRATLRQFLVLCHLRLGELAQAQKELDTLLAMDPPQAELLRRWFAEVAGHAGK